MKQDGDHRVKFSKSEKDFNCIYLLIVHLHTIPCCQVTILMDILLFGKVFHTLY